MTDRQCSECGKPLTDPVSRKLGIGPKCWLRKHGPSNRAPHAAIPAPKHTTDPDQISLPLEDTVDAEIAGMTLEERREYAGHLLLEHAREIEYLSVFEMYEAYTDSDDEISEEDARAVLDLAGEADIAITWPTAEHPTP